MPAADIGALPGMGTEVKALYRRIWWSIENRVFLPAGAVINGALSRDPGNTGYLDVLRAGTLMGKITATGLYAPCVIGVLQSAYTSGGTSLTLTAAQITELIRRIGSSGTGYVVGAPTATGTVAVTALTYSAASGTTITCTSLGVDKTAGSFICVDDGSHIPRTLITKQDGVKVTDRLGNSINVQFPEAPIGGMILGPQLLPWPADANTTLQAWVKDQLNTYGRFWFSDNFVAGV